MSVKFKFSDKAKEVISAVAPTLGKALGGPLGGLAGNMIAAAIGGGDQKAAEDALLAQSPETLLALRKSEQEFAVRMRELGIEESKLAYDDVKDARAMARLNMLPQIVIASTFIGGYFLVLLALLFGTLEVSESAKNIVDTMLLVLGGAIPMILQFFFGSSVGSREKTALLAGTS